LVTSSGFSKITPVEVKKTENNRFRVPIHLATNRFTFGKFLLHLKDLLETARKLLCDNLAQMRLKLSTIDVTAEAIFERGIQFQDWAHLGPE